MQRGSCSLDMSPIISFPADVSLHQSTKQKLLVEGPTQDGITSSAEDLIDENPTGLDCKFKRYITSVNIILRMSAVTAQATFVQR